jgi:hypothetical protein
MPSRGSLEATGALAGVLLGSLFHFTYGWSGNSPAVAWFSGVDESVWSHLNLVNLPWMVMTAVIYFSVSSSGDVLFSRAVGFLTTLLAIAGVFYLYTLGHTRKSVLAVDITLFVAAILLGSYVSWVSSRRWPDATKAKKVVGVGLHIVISALLVAFTYSKPSEGEPFYAPEHDDDDDDDHDE